MISLFENEAVANILQRIEKLNNATTRQWGKMDVAQMLAHCCVPLEVALGDKKYDRPLFAKLMGSFFKEKLTNDAPFGQGLPTDKHYIVADAREFLSEKARLIALINRFQQGNAAEIAARQHLLLGKITAEQWGKGMYKHLDHHLGQFGV